MITALVLIGIGLGMLFGSLLSRPLTTENKAFIIVVGVFLIIFIWTSIGFSRDIHAPKTMEEYKKIMKEK